jgi:hypothetical protein
MLFQGSGNHPLSAFVLMFPQQFDISCVIEKTLVRETPILTRVCLTL